MKTHNKTQSLIGRILAAAVTLSTCCYAIAADAVVTGQKGTETPITGIRAAASCPAVLKYVQNNGTPVEVQVADVEALYAAGGVWRSTPPQSRMRALEFFIYKTNREDHFSIPFPEITAIDMRWERTRDKQGSWTHGGNPLSIRVQKRDGTEISSGPTNSGTRVFLRLKRTVSSNFGERSLELNQLVITRTNTASPQLIAPFQVDSIRFLPNLKSASRAETNPK